MPNEVNIFGPHLQITGLFYNKSLWYDPLANDNRSEFELRSC
jgi:hypothetical protein